MSNSIIRSDVQAILDADLPWERFAGKRVLVTGAAGFLPAYIVETLLTLGRTGQGPEEVIGLVRNLEKARRRFAGHAADSRLRLVQADLCEPPPLDSSCNFIIHAASQASPKYYFTDPVGTLEPNVIGTHHLLRRAASDKAEGFLFFSSSEVYGQGQEGALSETSYGYLDPATVRSCYAESKRMGETLCVCATHQFDVPTFIVRLFHTYGPGLAADDGRVFSDFITNIVARRDFIITSDGLARRAFCYVSDAVRGIFTVLLKGKPAQPYNVGNDTAEVSIRELATILSAAFPDRNLDVVIDPAKAAASYAKSAVSRNCPDVDALRGLGWEPTIDIATGFKRTVAFIEGEPDLSSPVAPTAPDPDAWGR
ncbi:MAG: NAD-dependent epimerase/dehydratase family protein [Methylacidiphilales bacterium]|nr:NAD-dependent epimerase/dehydratase family protein [Candidatus Methylacidiphilales bacterium]